MPEIIDIIIKTADSYFGSVNTFGRFIRYKPRFSSYRNQSINLQGTLIDWFLRSMNIGCRWINLGSEAVFCRCSSK